MTQVVNLPAAEADLAGIALYIAEQSVDRARNLVARLRARCRILTAHPHAGRVRAELGEGLRSLVERPYIILYRINGDVVEIVAYVHGAQDLPSALAARLDRDED